MFTPPPVLHSLMTLFAHATTRPIPTLVALPPPYLAISRVPTNILAPILSHCYILINHTAPLYTTPLPFLSFIKSLSHQYYLYISPSTTLRLPVSDTSHYLCTVTTPSPYSLRWSHPILCNEHMYWPHLYVETHLLYLT